MKFLICLAFCIAVAQAGLLAAPVTTYSALAPVATYSAVAPVATYSAVSPLRYSTYAAAAAPVYRTPVTTYAAAPATVYTAPLTTYAATAVVSPFIKK
ncbi:cuticle protein 16.5-like [Drosophila innubila]|uniref:cuticle protein 16.5-like n=1 Tax=Drosophila innubila TaxID=198719 RepID=UPI00148C99D2|nr:cuticle protein 16.5-like [Drosophila innubila]